MDTSLSTNRACKKLMQILSYVFFDTTIIGDNPLIWSHGQMDRASKNSSKSYLMTIM